MMKIWSFFSVRPKHGEDGFAPSITQPDLSYSVKQLVEQYSIDQLPPMALLQPLFDEDQDDDAVVDAIASIRGADRADRYLAALENVRLRDGILDRVKRLAEFRKKEEAQYTHTLAELQEANQLAPAPSAPPADA